MDIRNLANNKGTEKMPVLFVGHGNPMNAITDNIYSRKWKEIGKELTTPKTILCISAHWLTKGTSVTLSEHPKTIHDFGDSLKCYFSNNITLQGLRDMPK